MTSPIFLLGEAQGDNEARIGAGFVGSSGVELLKMLAEAGCLELSSADRDYIYKYWSSGDPRHIDMVWKLHPEFYRSNVFQQHPPGNRIEYFCGPKVEALAGYPILAKSKYVRKEYAHELERLGEELLKQNPNLVVCLGNSALWAMCGTTGITKLRGTTRLSTHVVEGFKCLPTYHPAAVLRQWELRPVAVADLIKVRRESAFPEIRRPHREIWIEPSVGDIHAFVERHIKDCRLLSVDIETAGNQITCLGFAPTPQLAIVIPFHDGRRKGRNHWESKDIEHAVWKLIKTVLEDATIPKLFQNGLYDIAFLWRAYGIGVKGAAEDTMLLHHALQPESLKGLGFLGSVYTDEGAWKSDRKGTATIKRDE